MDSCFWVLKWPGNQSRDCGFRAVVVGGLVASAGPAVLDAVVVGASPHDPPVVFTGGCRLRDHLPAPRGAALEH